MDPSTFKYRGDAVLPDSVNEMYVETLLCDPVLLKKDIRDPALACIHPEQPTKTQVLRPDKQLQQDSQIKFKPEIYQGAKQRVQRRLAGCFSILWTAVEHKVNRESIPVELRFSTFTLSDADACR